MRDLPPDSLIARLVELRLCKAADVQRVRRVVRRMTRDLPVFDSVWIDALTQLKVLTPFQSRWLETSAPETLLVGDYRLLDGLGAGTASHTFLAMGQDRRRVVLKRLSLPADRADAVELRLELLVERSRNVTSPHLAVPTGLAKSPHGCFLVSRHVSGLNLSELLIRRGRFPASVVLTIADQLLSALSAWHATGIAHGDLRLTKLRLTDRGQIVLVDCGVQPTLSPELLVHTVHSPDVADVIAPERIGTNQPATAASDLYAAGCVLWQLLAGRPPHPQADPLTKLAAHQTKRIPDVREFAPDTPAKLAELIRALTSPNPQDRPSTAETARRQLGARGAFGTARLAAFRRQFDAAVPHLATRKAQRLRQWQGLTAAAVVLGIAILLMSDRGLRTELLNVAERTWNQGFPNREQQQDPADDQADEESADQLLRIPEPNAHGEIRFNKPGRYRLRELSQVGPLSLKAETGVRPQIVVDDEPWRITAQQVTLEGIDVVWTGPTAPLGPGSLLALNAQRFALLNCRFVGPQSGLRGADIPVGAQASMPVPPDPVEFSAVTWDMSDRRDPQAGVLEIEQTVLDGVMHGVTCLAAPRQVLYRQVLKTRRGSTVAVERASSAHGLKFVFDNVTLREAGPLVSCSGPITEEASASPLEIVSSNCVFDLAKSSAMVELRGPKVRDDWPEEIRALGDGCLLPPGATLLAHVDPQTGGVSVLENDEMQFEGLIIDEFEFAGPLSSKVADSQLVKTHAPRNSEIMPGVQTKLLPSGP